MSLSAIMEAFDDAIEKWKTAAHDFKEASHIDADSNCTTDIDAEISAYYAANEAIQHLYDLYPNMHSNYLDLRKLEIDAMHEKVEEMLKYRERTIESRRVCERGRKHVAKLETLLARLQREMHTEFIYQLTRGQEPRAE